MAADDIFSQAKHIRQLKEEKNLKTKEIAASLRMKPSYVCHINRLNRLPEMIVDGYYVGQVTISHLFIISRLKDEEAMITLYEKVLAEGLTVLQVEMEVRERLHKTKTIGSRIPQDQKERLLGIMEEATKANVSIIQSRIRSRICFEFKGNLKDTSAGLLGLAKKLESADS